MKVRFLMSQCVLVIVFALWSFLARSTAALMRAPIWLAGSRAAKKYSKLETLIMSAFTGTKMELLDLFLPKSRIACQSQRKKNYRSTFLSKQFVRKNTVSATCKPSLEYFFTPAFVSIRTECSAQTSTLGTPHRCSTYHSVESVKLPLTANSLRSFLQISTHSLQICAFIPAATLRSRPLGLLQNEHRSLEARPTVRKFVSLFVRSLMTCFTTPMQSSQI